MLQLDSQISNTEFLFVVFNQVNETVSADTLVMSGTVDVFTADGSTVDQWEPSVHSSPTVLKLTAPSTVSEDTALTFQPWALFLRGANGEWIAPLAFTAPGPP